MPLKPMVYLNLLKKYLKKYEARTFLVNTGWIGGAYGVGQRIPIAETRHIISAILSGKLNNVECRYDEIFNLFVPMKVPGVDPLILDPSLTWKDKGLYYESARKLAGLFAENIKKFPGVYQSIINSGPKLNS